MTPLRSVLLGFVILVAGARSAAAQCKGVIHWYGTPGGVAIPPTGVLYRYDSRLGKEARPEWYDATDASELVRETMGDPDHFPIDPAWQPPREAPRVVAMQRSTWRWCSEQDALAIQLDQLVAAVRVFWATPEGTNEMIIVSEPTTTFSGQPASVLLLGEPACIGENVPVADLERGVVLGLTAIRHDGSEVTVSGLPTISDLDDFPRAGRVIPLGFGIVGDDAVAVAVPAAPWRPRTHGAVPIVLVLGAVVFGARRGLAGATSRVVLPKARARR